MLTYTVAFKFPSFPETWRWQFHRTYWFGLRSRSNQLCRPSENYGVAGRWGWLPPDLLLPKRNMTPLKEHPHSTVFWWLKKMEMYSFIALEVGNPKLRCWQGHAVSKGSRGGSFLPLPAPGGSKYPWLVAVSLPSLPPLSYGFICVCIFSCPISYYDTCHWI